MKYTEKEIKENINLGCDKQCSRELQEVSLLRAIAKIMYNKYYV